MRREHTNWLDAFVEYGSYSEVPTKFLYWVGVSAIAGALERRVWIDQGTYTLYPNFYTVLVADAGKVKKSTAIKMAMALLRQVPGINFGPDTITWEALVQRMARTAAAENAGLSLDQANTTYSAVTADVDEISTFFDPTNKGLVSALIKLWDCPDKFDRETRMYGIEYIERPCLNMLAGTTPSWIRESFTSWSQKGGFASRAIFLHEFERRQLIAFPKRRMPSGRDATKRSLVADLMDIATIRGEYKIEEDAYDWGEGWYQEFHDRPNKGIMDSTGFTSRALDHVLKVAMILAASKHSKRYITLSDMKAAASTIDGIQGDLQEVFKVVDERAELRPFLDVREYIARVGKVKKSTVCAHFSNRFMLHEMDRALSLMRESDLIDFLQEGATMYLVPKETPGE